MQYRQDPMWQALAAMRIEPEGAATRFTAKLAREMRWSPSHAAAVVEEYRRFLYLAGIADRPVSPSKAVDKAWHLHLTYSRHYWDELCGRILGRPLHHDPSLGGAAEDARHRDLYARTLALYRATFGEEPPAAIWGQAAVRGPDPARQVGLVGVTTATLLLAACAASGSSGASGGELVIFGVMTALGLLAIIVINARKGRRPGRHGRRTGAAGGGAYGGSDTGSSDWDNDSGSDGGGDGGSSCGSSCGGGCGGGGGD